MKRRFVGIDGESYTVDGEHRYVLLADSNGEFIYNEEGIPTVECFHHLTEIRRTCPNGIFVAFGLNYDVNMMLRDIGKERLQALWKNHRIDWYQWHIEWIPGKWFSIKKEDSKPLRIYDVFGFFQKSFVNSLKSWGIELSEDLEEMKANRSIFDSTVKDEMIRYCIGECEKLVELMTTLKNALASVGLQPSSWVGAGSIASALLKREGVKQYHRTDDEFEEPVWNAILHSYFGGRVELFQQGYFDRLTDYDVCSAYPSQALHLPSLTGGIWKSADSYDANAPYAVWKVRWNIDPRLIVMPFPFRYKRGIYYPSNGTGWYHAPEVKRAVEHYGTDIEILEGYIYYPLGNEKPFDFIKGMYDYRYQLKREKHPGEKVLKLGLNAIYGKLAQGHGFAGNKPPFQSYYWAGRITSGTRARLFDIAMMQPESLVMVATDGIFFTDPAPELETSTVLGGLEKSLFTDAFIAQAGVYCGSVNGEYMARSRGFFSREIDFDQLRDGFQSDGPDFTASYSSTRFVGLGSALMRNDFSVWRTWNTANRKLSLHPNRKFVKSFTQGKPVRHHPPSFDIDLQSEIYVPKDGAMQWTNDAVEYVEGLEQPLKEF